MATLVLGAIGGAIGGSIGGSLLGLPAAVIGRAIGATLGAVIDQRVLGQGSDPVEIGRQERLRIMGAGEGTPLARVQGAMRVGGHLIWSSRFREHVSVTRSGGKGGGPSATVERYSYTISFALALCEGEVSRIGRIWADGEEISLEGVTWRLYRGTADQMPDPLIAAVEGADAPAYRDTAYLVFEEFALGDYGNRIPQISVEVFRRPRVPAGTAEFDDLADLVQGVALIPGSGEHALSTDRVRVHQGPGRSRLANVHSRDGRPDLIVSLDQLEADLPRCRSVSLVVSWFGDDLRCGTCRLEPAAENAAVAGGADPWSVGGVGRDAAKIVSQVDGRPAFGGTPSDRSVLQAIAELKGRGQAVTFYPFILMDIQSGNGRDNPHAPGSEQPSVPWRGRITLSAAPGQAGSPDGTAQADAEVAAFFGSAQASDFDLTGDAPVYTGPPEWSYRRCLLHYAHLVAMAGGVEMFCIGSELRGLTQIRGAGGHYPAVAALRQLAADIRAILGSGVKLTYAADWSEYFGHQPQDGSGDVRFHLDPLWSDPVIDAVAIDNYMPLSDWRDGEDHADERWRHGSDPVYLQANIEGGEGFDWYYPSETARLAQERVPITDGAHGEPWVFRYKDLRSWWGKLHFERIGGERASAPTGWLPGMKPIIFTELGCPAVDKGANQPNLFVDPASSESALPHFSRGGPDPLVQAAALQAVLSYWAAPGRNPVSQTYGGPMIDLSQAHVWAWDARPYPDFPRQLDSWSDGANHLTGHWLNGRSEMVDLRQAVREICAEAGLHAVDTSGLHGRLRGTLDSQGLSGRARLQALMQAHRFEAHEAGGRLRFRSRDGRADDALSRDGLVEGEGDTLDFDLVRQPEGETPAAVDLTFVDPDRDYQAGAARAALPDVQAAEARAAARDLPVALSGWEAEAVVRGWLAAVQAGRDTLSCALPLSRLGLDAGDVLQTKLGGTPMRFRIDRVTVTDRLELEAMRIDPASFRAETPALEVVGRPAPVQPVPVHALWLDLPLLAGDEPPHAPYVAATAVPWPGPVAVWQSPSDTGFARAAILDAPATAGQLTTGLDAAAADRWQGGAGFQVHLVRGTLSSRTAEDVLAGANAAALRAGGSDAWEVIQFREAVLVAPDLWQISGLLRGQAGTDAVMRTYGAGADFLLLDGAARPLDLPPAALGSARMVRVGPAGLPYDHDAYIGLAGEVQGVGLRPYRPVHLAARPDGAGGVHLSWVRRTRVGGDGWAAADVPLSEDRELYRVRIWQGGQVVRDAAPEQPDFTYDAAMRAVDGVTGGFHWDVAQVSALWGTGPEQGSEFDG
ncbi:baseplate multidomain protein megatron [Oceanomicrobium pacificus]|uniref:Host specificity protein n=1 Tax=Oceanomicrobium pacificus TaxID=2692916 RepID=A0A6B0TX82_9RHOB|nr:glycoside hydrolase/phage tail family protein [Oceanomicrobium pacificus]MXU66325.1 host specificity protein [Oceanomicrobium pacificus]